MPDSREVAAAIDQRVGQLEAQGIRGRALVDHMLGHMHDLQRLYETVPDHVLLDLCRRFPGFERYALLLEEVSEKNGVMIAAGTHPYGELPELPESLKSSLIHLMRGGVELERLFQAFVEAGRADQADKLTAMRRTWAADFQTLVSDFRASDVPPQAQAVVQQVVKAMAERIERMTRE